MGTFLERRKDIRKLQRTDPDGAGAGDKWNWAQGSRTALIAPPLRPAIQLLGRGGKASLEQRPVVRARQVPIQFLFQPGVELAILLGVLEDKPAGEDFQTSNVLAPLIPFFALDLTQEVLVAL